ncbi:AsmA-like C-terminal region-containing protein [Hymenobacter endophyticus]|uniref:AsmA-like C-terminal region-containing protein n=1 Tax=Hymenobacter endophyticus TaxID=3076335 RepID=A0ABU3TEX3_9BACT|nr:AsmA-like C-terminal region-containing protein [Hymenobacter endophyticus]MDU0369931.1 AsmA-like C-terminal region-containing protein [Hymenobacter endophyticus]
MRRFLKIFCFTLLGLLTMGWLGLWLGQDYLVGLFVRGLNQYLCVPVHASRLEVSALDQFPRLSVTLHDVTVRGSVPTDTVRLARARRLYCAFNAWDLVSGHYRIREVTLTDARVHIRRNQQDVGNYHIICPDTAAVQPDDTPFKLALEGIRLERVAVVYEDAGRRQYIALHTPVAQAQVAIIGPLVEVAATGEALVRTVRLGSDDYFQQKLLQLRAAVRIDRQQQQLTIQPSEIGVGPARYSLAGSIGYRGAPQLNVRCEAAGADVQAVLALLPPRLTRSLAGYRSRGQVYFGGTVQGEWSDKQNPAVQVQFGCRQASFFHPKYRQAVEQVSLRGTFSNGAARNGRTAVLALQNIQGQLAGRAFSGQLRLENFINPQLVLTARADVDLRRAVQFFPVAAVQSAQGEAQVALQLNGPLRSIRARPTARQASGQLTFRGVTLRLRDFRQPFTGLAGRLELRGADVAFPSIVGRLGNSDFQARGTLHNITGWATNARQPLRVEAAVTSELLDFNQLLYVYQPVKSSAAKPGQPASGGLHVPATLALSVQTQARQVRFRRLRGRQLRGTMRLQNQVFSSPGLTLLAAGGRISVRGTVDARRTELLKASTVASCQQLPLDSLFYVFENFGQQFITARHLRGRLTATAESDTYFDAHLSPLTERLEAEVHATIQDGQLLDFEPLQRLSLVANRATLRHLRFAELRNSLYVQSRTVYIPQMDIRSNVRAASLIRITGTHTFDQQIDYHVQIPLLPGLLSRVAARADGPGLRLAIQGSEDQFTVRYEAGPGRPAPAPTATPSSTAPVTATPAAPPVARPASRPSFEVKKPVKQPAQPQTGEYFEF